MSDGWKAFAALGGAFAAHDSVCHSEREYVRGLVHANSAEGFNDRVRRTVSGVFHHISPHHADLYFNEIGFRWSQRTVAGRAVRRTRKAVSYTHLTRYRHHSTAGRFDQRRPCRKGSRCCGERSVGNGGQPGSRRDRSVSTILRQAGFEFKLGSLVF